MSFTRQLPALYNGVSQQPPVVRSPSQAEEQINGWSSVVDGVGKRPPTEYVASLGAPVSNAFIHKINRDVDERYTVIITDGDLRVFDEKGNEITVNFPAGKGYLESPDAQREFAAVSMADYTFIANKTHKVKMEPKE